MMHNSQAHKKWFREKYKILTERVAFLVMKDIRFSITVDSLDPEDELVMTCKYHISDVTGLLILELNML